MDYATPGDSVGNSSFDATPQGEVEQVLVIGGTGSIGRLVVQQLVQRGFSVRALTRDAVRARTLLGDRVRLIEGDLAVRDDVVGALEGVGAVILTHGAPYGSGHYEAVDYGAIPALLDALAGRSLRVVLMSSIGVTGAGGTARNLLDWKLRAERLVRASGLAYTVVRPGWFDAGDPSSERVELRQGDRVEYGTVRRSHVAGVLVDSLLCPHAQFKTVEVFSAAGRKVYGMDALFAQAQADVPMSLDGAQDRPGLHPVDCEPETVRADLERFSRR